MLSIKEYFKLYPTVRLPCGFQLVVDKVQLRTDPDTFKNYIFVMVGNKYATLRYKKVDHSLKRNRYIRKTMATLFKNNPK